MSGFNQFPGGQVRARLDHPVIDGDAHMVECDFAFFDFLKQVGGAGMVQRSEEWRKNTFGKSKGGDVWWGLPSGPHTSDRAMAMLPRLFKSRMEEAGIDFAFMHATTGITNLYIADDELRQASCRALNMLYAEMFSGVTDRIRPVAVIPTYTPEEAIREMDYAVTTLGLKSTMIGTEIRRPAPGGGVQVESIAMDAPFDYDPFWQRCVDLGVAPIGHTPGFGGRTFPHRASPTNYVFNHLGGFAAGAEFFCRSVFFGGVMHRFPTLNFGFLEGGVAWAQTLINDIFEHWEKRNRRLIHNLNPKSLNLDLMEKLFNEYGSERLTGSRIRAEPHHMITAAPIDPPQLDDFAASGMNEVHDLKHLFTDRFYFGCEADDRMVAVAFNRRLNPVGAKLKAVFGSDIGHWDVLDAKSILSETYSLVDGKLLDLDNLRDLTFVNPASLHLSMNPDCFVGTAVEDAAAALLREQQPMLKAA